MIEMMIGVLFQELRERKMVREKNIEGRKAVDPKILAIFSRIPCRNQPECKWKSSCWYMHDYTGKKQIEMKHHTIKARENCKEEKENDLAVNTFNPLKDQVNNSVVTDTKPQTGCLGQRYKSNSVKKKK